MPARPREAGNPAKRDPRDATAACRARPDRVFLLGGAFFEIIRDRFPPASRPRIPLFRTRTSYESIRLWCIDFGPKFGKRLRRRHGGFGDTFHVDEVFVKIRGKQHYLWRAVDQDGDVIDVFLQDRREAGAAKRFFRRLILRHGDQPWKVITDKLGSYRVAHRELVPDSFHVTYRYANNRAHADNLIMPRSGSNPLIRLTSELSLAA